MCRQVVLPFQVEGETMTLRNKMNESPVIPVIVVLIALAICGYIAWKIFSPSQQGQTGGDWFYSIDDGKTVFADNHRPNEPFQKDGKDAYLAMMFTCDNNKTTFCGYLMKREEVPAKFKGAPPDAKMTTNFIKKPGDTEWISETNIAKWNQIERGVKCPDGSTPAMVTPKGMVVEAKRPGPKGK